MSNSRLVTLLQATTVSAVLIASLAPAFAATSVQGPKTGSMTVQQQASTAGSTAKGVPEAPSGDAQTHRPAPSNEPNWSAPEYSGGVP